MSKLLVRDLVDLSYAISGNLPKEEDGMTSEKVKYWENNPDELKKALAKALSEVPSLS